MSPQSSRQGSPPSQQRGGGARPSSSSDALINHISLIGLLKRRSTRRGRLLIRLPPQFPEATEFASAPERVLPTSRHAKRVGAPKGASRHQPLACHPRQAKGGRRWSRVPQGRAHVAYQESALDTWAASLISKPLRST